MDSIFDTIDKIRSEISTSLESKSLSDVHTRNLVSALSDYLDEIEDYLTSKSFTKAKLDGFSFGIFRLVTDDSQLEKSPLGQDLLNFSVMLRKLGKKQ
jgi:hypothetical protein